MPRPTMRFSLRRSRCADARIVKSAKRQEKRFGALQATRRAQRLAHWLRQNDYEGLRSQLLSSNTTGKELLHRSPSNSRARAARAGIVSSTPRDRRQPDEDAHGPRGGGQGPCPGVPACHAYVYGDSVDEYAGEIGSSAVIGRVEVMNKELMLCRASG